MSGDGRHVAWASSTRRASVCSSSDFHILGGVGQHAASFRAPEPARSSRRAHAGCDCALAALLSPPS
eukprot:1258178-Prymnesium_polylepis.1